MKKNVVSMLLAGVMIFAAGAVYGDEVIKMIEVGFDRTVNYKVDNDFVHYRGALVYEDANYAPVRPIAEAMGGKVTWNEKDKTVEIDTSKSDNFDFSKIKGAIDMYLKDENLQGRGSLSDITNTHLIEGNFREIADMGFRVTRSNIGDSAGELINIALPDVQKNDINKNPAWMDASRKIFGEIMNEFEAKKWDFCGTMTPSFEGNFIWVYSGDGKVAIITRGEHVVSINISYLNVFVETISQKDVFQNGYTPATDGGVG